MKKAVIFILVAVLFGGVLASVEAAKCFHLRDNLSHCAGLAQVGNGAQPYYSSTNRAPFFLYPREAEFNINAGEELSFSVYASDPDYDILTYSAFNLPPESVFDTFNRGFWWRPANGGNFAVTFRVFDGHFAIDKNVRINVTGPTVGSAPANTNTTNTFSSNTGVTPLEFVNFNPLLNGREGQLYIYTVQARGGNGSQIIYRLSGAPTGMTIHSSLGTILWVPNHSQGRPEAYTISVVAGNNQTEIARSFNIIVEDVPLPTVQSQTALAEANTKTVYIDRFVPERLKIYDAKTALNDRGEVTVAWDSNKPSRGRVVYDNISQAEKTANFTYANATSETAAVIHHEINIGKIESNIAYYLRAVSKTDSEIAVSNEIIIVQLSDRSLKTFNLAAFFGGVAGFVFGHPFLFLLAITVVLLIYFYRRSQA